MTETQPPKRRRKKQLQPKANDLRKMPLAADYVEDVPERLDAVASTLRERSQYQKAKATVESGLEGTGAETAAPKPAHIVDAGDETSLVPAEGYNKVEEWTE